MKVNVLAVIICVMLLPMFIGYGIVLILSQPIKFIKE